MNELTSAACRCGKVELQIVGAPMLRVICYCASCQEAGRRYPAMPGVDSVLAEDGRHGLRYLSQGSRALRPGRGPS
jgi:hypothetical protein